MSQRRYNLIMSSLLLTDTKTKLLLWEEYLANRPDNRAKMTREQFYTFLLYLDLINNLDAQECEFLNRQFISFKFDKRITPLLTPASVTMVPYNQSTSYDFMRRTETNDILVGASMETKELSYKNFLFLQNLFISGFIRRGSSVNQDCDLTQVKNHLMYADVMGRLTSCYEMTTVKVDGPDTELLEVPITVLQLPVYGNAASVPFNEACVVTFRRVILSLRRNS